MGRRCNEEALGNKIEIRMEYETTHADQCEATEGTGRYFPPFAWRPAERGNAAPNATPVLMTRHSSKRIEMNVDFKCNVQASQGAETSNPMLIDERYCSKIVLLH
eukprot:6196667-Pleurochrysis_carterae.AAC.2